VSRLRIVVPDDFASVFAGSAAEQEARALGDVTVYTEPGADDEAELIRRVGDADVMISIHAYARVSAAVLAACSRLRLVSVWGTGTDHVDLAACKARGVTVARTPGVNAHAVAEHVMALMLAITRRIPAMDRAVRSGRWANGDLVQLEGKTLGIVGLGAIGGRVATLAAPFGMRLLASTLGDDAGRSAALGARHVPIDTLLRESDVVTLHWRLGDATRNYFTRERLALMKPTAYLINTARAALVDHEALVEALRESRIAGAGLDVFHEEPVPAGDPLLALPNVVLTPHNAGATPEVIDSGLRLAVRNIADFIRTTGARA
jgi:D-3-phosphoglycerate dehydrogenase / 2-oxoglutarate reductase